LYVHVLRPHRRRLRRRQEHRLGLFELLRRKLLDLPLTHGSAALWALETGSDSPIDPGALGHAVGGRGFLSLPAENLAGLDSRLSRGVKGI